MGLRDDIEKDFERVLRDPRIADFKKGLEFKSKRTAAKDKEAFNFLLQMLDLYKNGWIMANAAQNLGLESKMRDNKECFYYFRVLSDTLNRLIKEMSLKGLISPQKLEALREVERKLQKLERDE